MLSKFSKNFLDLVFIALVTLVSMGIVHLFFQNINLPQQKTSVLTSSPSQVSPE